MIPGTADDRQGRTWRQELARAVTDPAELLRLLELPPELLAPAQAAAQTFGLRVPLSYLALMEPGNPRDPLLRQVLPLPEELARVPGFSTDPLGEIQATGAGGLVEKYRGRALLLASSQCALHCRFCFRRAFPFGRFQVPRRDAWDTALARLQARPEIREIILSGGDPLVLDDHHLGDLVRRLDALPQLRRLRIHTRLPVAIPARVTAGLCRLLRQTRLAPALVLHVNHPRELAPDRVQALRRLRRTCVLLNQSVLLAGVNDSLPVLAELGERLFDAGVIPYYIHVLDPIQGAAHFAVSPRQARTLMRGLRQRLPGYLVPRLVREMPGASSKLPLDDQDEDD